MKAPDDYMGCTSEQVAYALALAECKRQKFIDESMPGHYVEEVNSVVYAAGVALDCKMRDWEPLARRILVDSYKVQIRKQGVY